MFIRLYNFPGHYRPFHTPLRFETGYFLATSITVTCAWTTSHECLQAPALPGDYLVDAACPTENRTKSPHTSPLPGSSRATPVVPYASVCSGLWDEAQALILKAPPRVLAGEGSPLVLYQPTTRKPQNRPNHMICCLKSLRFALRLCMMYHVEPQSVKK